MLGEIILISLPNRHGVDTPSKTKRPVCITKDGLQKRWMKTASYSFEQNQRHYIASSANLHCHWSAAGGAWRRRICLLWRLDIHILFLRFKRDWRPYRLYSTENEVISSVPQSASRSQRKSKNYFLSSVMIANHDGQHGNTRHQMSTCPKIFWDVRLAVRKQGAGELAPIRTGCFHFDLQQFYPFTPKKVNCKFLLQPHQKYHIRWYAHSSLRWKMIYLYQFSLPQSLIHFSQKVGRM